MEVKARLHKARFFVECDLADKKMEKKIREAQLDQFNYILVRGLETSTHLCSPVKVPCIQSLVQPQNSGLGL